MKDDTISRAAAVKTVKKHYRGIDNDLLEVIAYEMEELPPTQPGWIPCSERLPKLNGYYLATIKWGEDFYEVDCYEYDSYYKEWNEGEYFGGTVVAWMPLPTPYREGGQ